MGDVTAWSVGDNDPGCLPESDPALFGTWVDAVDYLRSEMIEWADADDDSADEDEHGMTLTAPATRAAVDAVLRDARRPVDGADWSAHIFDNRGWPRVWWIERVTHHHGWDYARSVMWCDECATVTDDCELGAFA